MSMIGRRGRSTVIRVSTGANVIDARVQSPGQILTDSAGVVWRITPMAQCSYNGTADTGTDQVFQMFAISDGNIWQINSANNFYFKAATASPVAGGWSGPVASPLSVLQPIRIADVLATFCFNTPFNQGPTGAQQVAAAQTLRAGSNAFKVFRTYCRTLGFPTPAQELSLISDGCRGLFVVALPGTLPSGTVNQDNVNSQITETGINSIWGFESTNEPILNGLSTGQVQTIDTSIGTAVANNGSAAGRCPVMGFSSAFTGNMSTVTTYAAGVGNETGFGIHWSNWHGYINNGAGVMIQPFAALDGPADALNNRATLAPGRPWVMTEMGGEAPGTTASYGTSTPASGGKLRLNYYLDNYLLGCAGTFDWLFHPSENLGLFLNNLTPTGYVTTISNFCSIVKDTGGTALTFTPSLINYTVSNLPSDGHVLKTQGSDGKDRLIIWNEPALTNGTPTDLTVTPVNVTVTLNQGVSSALRYDCAVGTASVQTYGTSLGTVFTVPISGYPQVVIITP